MLNVNKTTFIHKKKYRNLINPQITIDTYEIEQLSLTKCLGIIIHSNLTCDEHIIFILQKLLSGL